MQPISYNSTALANIPNVFTLLNAGSPEIAVTIFDHMAPTNKDALAREIKIIGETIPPPLTQGMSRLFSCAQIASSNAQGSQQYNDALELLGARLSKSGIYGDFQTDSQRYLVAGAATMTTQAPGVAQAPAGSALQSAVATVPAPESTTTGTQAVFTGTVNLNPNSTFCKAFTKFGIDLLKAMHADQIKKGRHDNIVMSPLSVAIAMTMLYEGAGEKTRASMRKFLAFNHMSIDEVSAYCKTYIDSITGAGTGVTLNMGQAVYVAPHETLTEQFKKAMADVFGADFGTVSPGDETKINAFIDGKTNHLIPKLLPDGVINRDTVFVLVNALYFFGFWASKFDEANTIARPFTDTKGAKTVVDRMHQKGTFDLITDKKQGCSVLAMPYGEDEGTHRFMRLVVLPNKGETIDDVVPRLTPETFQGWLATIESECLKTEVIVGLPKAKVEQLGEILGVVQTLPGGNGLDDISNMVNGPGNIFVSAIYAGATFEDSEKGTEAVGATAILGSRSLAAPPAPKVFVVEGPYLSAIVDTQTGTIAFMTVTNHPTESTNPGSQSNKTPFDRDIANAGKTRKLQKEDWG